MSPDPVTQLVTQFNPPLNCVTRPGDTIGDTIRTRTPVTVESVQSELCHRKAVTQIGDCDTIGDTIKPTLTRGFTPLGELCHRMYCVTGVLGLQVFTTRKNSPSPSCELLQSSNNSALSNRGDTIRRGHNRTKKFISSINPKCPYIPAAMT